MSTVAERQALLALLTAACDAGARLGPACAQIGLSERTVQRWQRRATCDESDRRASCQRVATPPPNRLSEIERRAAMALLNSDEFKDLPPSQIVPRLADQGRFVASESTLYRLLRSAGQLAHRRGERAPLQRSRPRALAATGPDQVYCWDISDLPTDVRGVYFYLYLFVDLFSRKIVGWQVYDSESADRAGKLLTDICARQRIAPQQLTLHSDNGSPMKGESMLATLQRLGVAASRSRPAVSNDNPFSEALFRTLKYRPQLPVKPLQSLLHARRWAAQLVHWYNHEHRNSAIGEASASPFKQSKFLSAPGGSIFGRRQTSWGVTVSPQSCQPRCSDTIRPTVKTPGAPLDQMGRRGTLSPCPYREIGLSWGAQRHRGTVLTHSHSMVAGGLLLTS